MATDTKNLLAIEGGEPVVPSEAHHVWPEITQADRDAVGAVLDRGELWGAYGVEVTALQQEYAQYCGVEHCLAVNSGTAALHCALVACGVQPGDEVIVPAFSFVATAMAVLHAGAVPVFCDIDPRAFNIDPALVESLITDRTAAIVPVHIHGVVADMDALRAIAARHGLPIVEDAAQAHGSTYHGRKAGTLATCAAFSLNGAKNLSAGEGGLFVTDDPEIFKAARRLAIFGEDTPRPQHGEVRAFWSRGVGWNYRVHEITAALARSQLRRLDSYNVRAQENAAILTHGLADMAGIEPPFVPEGLESVYFRYRLRLDPAALGWQGSDVELRDRMLHALRAEGVAASTWQLWPLPAQPAFRHESYAPWSPKRDAQPLKPWDPGAFPQASRLLDLSLVLGPDREPLYVQDQAVMELYLQAFAKVLDRIDVVLCSDYEPVRVIPPIPAGEL
ncbi:MAG TPA: DegT/DnrJ/EryC1/StrS family aminotransferase [Solirubrobacteraceae bacterium]|nr:DegT/DnrJ/EryC1/StrS family aminotransferase [Solirubrobacteraceae bacterium]